MATVLLVHPQQRLPRLALTAAADVQRIPLADALSLCLLLRDDDPGRAPLRASGAAPDRGGGRASGRSHLLHAGGDRTPARGRRRRGVYAGLARVAGCAPNRATDASAAQRVAGSRVTQARRDSIRRQRLASLEWDKSHPTRPDPAEFTREILPQLAGVSYSALSRASGLSRRYCKLIATGQYVPHPVHWDALRSAVARTSDCLGWGGSSGGLPGLRAVI
jgi:hypothetical protein